MGGWGKEAKNLDVLEAPEIIPGYDIAFPNEVPEVGFGYGKRFQIWLSKSQDFYMLENICLPGSCFS